MIDGENAENERRWAELMEAEASGELSEAERVELDELTSRTEERRQERRLLASMRSRAGFDPELSRDDERLIETVLVQHNRRRHRRTTVLWLAAAALLIPLVAAAAFLPRLFEADEPPDGPAALPAVSTGTLPPSTPKPEASPPPADPTEPALPSAPAATRPTSPADLLAKAQRARAARDYRGAIHAYQELLRLHPKSSVAPLAWISLAQLQLAQGDAKAALAGFEAYERSGGALSQEAHYGRIQALRALGRTAEEHAEIRRFLDRYPKSLQAAALRKRLGENGDGD